MACLLINLWTEHTVNLFTAGLFGTPCARDVWKNEQAILSLGFQRCFMVSSHAVKRLISNQVIECPLGSKASNIISCHTSGNGVLLLLNCLQMFTLHPLKDLKAVPVDKFHYHEINF